jgi:hypothetical protein
MKVAVGMTPYAGPWGGGNRFVSALTEALREAGHTAVHTLEDCDLDVILLVDPRTRSPNVTFGAGDILRYLALVNDRAIVVHRINECDERKGERFINQRLARANYVADATAFVGAWLAELPVWRENLRHPWFVVRNGADTRTFNAEGFSPWSGDGRLSLVTHHWGYHRFKGFDVYERLDAALAEPEFARRFDFTYIGNLPAGMKFTHAAYVAPLDGLALAAELKRHHAYVTGSINEPGGNHQNEGALCGLPLLYRNSGCMPEYCQGFGIAFNGPQDVLAALERLAESYDRLVPKMTSYPNTAERMTRDWIALFERLAASRDDLIANRCLWRQPVTALATQWPF